LWADHPDHLPAAGLQHPDRHPLDQGLLMRYETISTSG
jgi:hypothetical protein